MTGWRTRSCVLGALGAVALLSSCSTGAGDHARADSSPAIVATVSPTTSTIAATLPPTTLPSTTTSTSTTTLPTTTTTVAPPPTIPPPPSNVVPAPWSGEPFPVVGSRSGDGTAVVQARLLELGFWLSGVDGKYGLTTKQAVMAFQKYTGLEASGKVDDATAQMLATIGERAHGFTNTGTVVEINKLTQLLFIVVDGQTQWTFNTSTGDGEPYIEEDQNSPGEQITGVSLTPDGLYKVHRERPEGWWEGDLGEIYRPKYFIGGVAVHGSNSVPNHPASHGCVRVTVPAMDFIWDSGLVPLGTTVWVHEGVV